MSVGSFSILPLSILEIVCLYCVYSEAQALRGCSRFFHNYTKNLRFRWNIHPMRNKKGDFMIVLFLKWSRSFNWNIEKEINRKKLGVFHDIYGNLLCSRHLNMKRCDMDRGGNCLLGKSHLAIDLDYFSFERSEFYVELKVNMYVYRSTYA
jgi:hypothetical protein